MAGAPEGRIESVHERGATPTDDPNNKVKGDVGAPPHLWVEQLKGRHKDIEDAQL